MRRGGTLRPSYRPAEPTAHQEEEIFSGASIVNVGSLAACVVAALNSGGLIDEFDRACRPIRDAAARGQDGGTEEFLASWTAVVDGLERAARDDLDRKRHRSAVQKLIRATN